MLQEIGARRRCQPVGHRSTPSHPPRRSGRRLAGWRPVPASCCTTTAARSRTSTSGSNADGVLQSWALPRGLPTSASAEPAGHPGSGPRSGPPDLHRRAQVHRRHRVVGRGTPQRASLRLRPARPPGQPSLCPDPAPAPTGCCTSPRTSRPDVVRAGSDPERRSRRHSSDQPTPPALCSAWAAFLAPGMGTAPLLTSQFSATWAGVRPSWLRPISVSWAMTGRSWQRPAIPQPAYAGRRAPGDVLPGQQTLGQRAVGDDRHLELPTDLQQPGLLWPAVGQAVLHLVGRQRHAQVGQRPLRRPQLASGRSWRRRPRRPDPGVRPRPGPAARPGR